MNAKAIADRFTVELQWLREYATRADLIVAWNRQSEAREMLLEARNGPHAADGWIRSFAHPRYISAFARVRSGAHVGALRRKRIHPT